MRNGIFTFSRKQPFETGRNPNEFIPVISTMLFFNSVFSIWVTTQKMDPILHVWFLFLMCLQILIFIAILINYFCACYYDRRKSESSKQIKANFTPEKDTEITNVWYPNQIFTIFLLFTLSKIILINDSKMIWTWVASRNHYDNVMSNQIIRMK